MSTIDLDNAQTERPREWVEAYCDTCKRLLGRGEGAKQAAREIRGAQAHANLTGHVIEVKYGHRAHGVIEEVPEDGS